MKRALRGIIHVHSHYSYDGKHSLSEIAETVRRFGLDFVCMTEHSDTLDEEKVNQLVADCKSVSSSEILMIPGIEFTCHDNLHLLGIGIRKYNSSMDPVYLCGFIQQNNALAVVAHPFRKIYPMLHDLLPIVDGIEVWNCVYDGRFFPNAKALDLYVQAKKFNPDIVAFCGRDLHRLANIHQTFIQLESCELDEKSILNLLRNGAFMAISPWSKLSALPNWGPFKRFRFYLQHVTYSGLKQARNTLLKLAFPHK